MVARNIQRDGLAHSRLSITIVRRGIYQLEVTKPDNTQLNINILF